MAQARALSGARGWRPMGQGAGDPCRCGWCRGTAQVIPTGAWGHFNLWIQQQAFTVPIASRDPTMWPYLTSQIGLCKVLSLD